MTAALNLFAAALFAGLFLLALVLPFFNRQPLDFVMMLGGL